MAYWAGAAFDDAPWAPVMHNHPYGRFDSFYLHVNSRGERFMNEDTWMQAKSVRIGMQPEPTSARRWKTSRAGWMSLASGSTFWADRAQCRWAWPLMMLNGTRTAV